MGAIGKRVTVAPACRVKGFLNACRADSRIGWHTGGDMFAAFTGRNNKASTGLGRLRALRSMCSMVASGGHCCSSSAAKRAKLSGAPQRSICTPSPSLRTCPDRLSELAMRQTVGRKPTPCTTPVTLNRSPFTTGIWVFRFKNAR